MLDESCVAYQMVKVQQEEHFRTLQKERAEKELEQLFWGLREAMNGTNRPIWPSKAS